MRASWRLSLSTEAHEPDLGASLGRADSARTSEKPLSRGEPVLAEVIIANCVASWVLYCERDGEGRGLPVRI